MSKNIVQQLVDSVSIEELCGIFDNIPLHYLEKTIRSTDTLLKDQLIQHAHTIHMSMQSYHNMGSVEVIRHEFSDIEKYLKRIVYHDLPAYKKIFIFLVEFFRDYSPQDELEESIKKIQSAQQEISVYNTVLTQHSKKFLKYVAIYDRWIIALSRFVLGICERYGMEQEELSYTLSKLIIQTSETLVTQKQLEQTIMLQLQSNTVVITDILHIIGVSRSLMQNTISAKQFFQQDYVGSIKIIKKYRNKQ